ncbi:unnamed protein product [Orchesella dallaii]|uniref:TAZ-type domain-containing protein n=1 Tax=Orchesella dallaii TaxID=48710 RepID=A0ABP1R5Q8_9HEXA
MLPPDTPETTNLDATVGASALPISPVMNETSLAVLCNLMHLIRIEKHYINEPQARANYVDEDYNNQHIANCQDPNCPIMHCCTSRDLYTHWKSCKKQECHICESEVELTIIEFIDHLTKKGIYEQMADEVERMRKNLTYMKAMMWINL